MSHDGAAHPWDITYEEYLDDYDDYWDAIGPLTYTVQVQLTEDLAEAYAVSVLEMPTAAVRCHMVPPGLPFTRPDDVAAIIADLGFEVTGEWEFTWPTLDEKSEHVFGGNYRAPAPFVMVQPDGGAA